MDTSAVQSVSRDRVTNGKVTTKITASSNYFVTYTKLI